ncbi:hypothetical protein CDD83_8852 [Cordyceps sp. RAO-2017]|nr:hypothetical protein CDD83_8852 [Cordyceps sp. RAO-2017]
MAPTTASDPPPPPPLSFEALTAPDDQRAALRLVADSIAQQRQVASLAIIFHPACFVGLAAACSLVWSRNARDPGTALMAVCGLVMAYLAAVRLYTSPFLGLAERFDCDAYPRGPDGSRDLVLGARFGPDLIGTLVLRLRPPPSTGKDGPASSSSSSSSPRPVRGGSGLIRAWTTKLRYRNKGIGADLLRFAVAATRSACGDGADVAFDPAHANSAFPLSRLFSRPFDSRDEKAARALEHALRDGDAGTAGFSIPESR